MRYATAQSGSRRGLTLVELLVVLVILGLVVTVLVPSAQSITGRAQQRDLEQRLHASWRLARAMAVAGNSPVYWTLEQSGGAVTVTIGHPDADEAGGRRLVFDGCEVEMESGPRPVEPGRWRVIVAPHGLTDSLELKFQRDSRSVRVDLPGVLEEPVRAGPGGDRR